MVVERSTDTEKVNADEMQWYIVRTATGFENRVVLSLKHEIALKKLESSFGRMLVPTEEVVEMRGGQKRKSQRKFFPGYLLIEMCMNDDTWHLVRHTSKVLGFVGGTKGQPVPIGEDEVNAVLGQIEDGADKPRPKVLFEAGEVVRVKEGPFADFSGVVEDVNYEKNRIRVSVSIFGRSTPVELEFSQVEKS